MVGSRSSGKRAIWVAMALSLAASTALAQGGGYAIPWFTVDGGGAAGDRYTLNGTAGQSDAGTLADAAYTLEGGFWPGVRTGGGPPVHTVHLPLVVQNSARQQLPSSDLIDAAEKSGALDASTALLYRVYAAFADSRLPEPYRGDDRAVLDSQVMDQVVDRFSALPAATQALLAPYLLTPPAPGSWWDQRAQASAPAAEPARSGTWKKIAVAGGKLKVWFQPAYGEPEAAKATELATAIDRVIYPRLLALLLRDPLSDGNYPDHGDDGATDIYMVHGLKDDLGHGVGGLDVPYAGCGLSPSHILLDSAQPGYKYALVHELMHAFVHSYTLALAWGCDEYLWLKEATATWAIDYVYPSETKYEQGYVPYYLDDTAHPLETPTPELRQYGAYLFFFYLTHQLQNPELIRQIIGNMQTMNSLAAVNAVIPNLGGEGTGFGGGAWAQFARYNWLAPPKDMYRQWDQLEERPRAEDGVHFVSVGATEPYEQKLPTKVEHLSIVYSYFLFEPESNARMVTFFNGLTYKLGTKDAVWDFLGVTIRDGSQIYGWDAVPAEQKKGAKVQALYRLAGSDDWQEADWTDKPYVSFCRDAKAERLEELVIIQSNSEHEDRGYTVAAQGLAPRLRASDIGCWQWQGSATHIMDIHGGGLTSHTVEEATNAVWERDQGYPDIPYPYVTYHLKQAAWTWQRSGTWDCCTFEGSDARTLGNDPQNSRLYTFFGVLSGPSVRRYWGYGNTNFDVTEIQTCSCMPGGPITTDTDGWFAASFARHLHPWDAFTVATGGTALADSETWETAPGDERYEWRFEAQREP